MPYIQPRMLQKLDLLKRKMMQICPQPHALQMTAKIYCFSKRLSLDRLLASDVKEKKCQIKAQNIS